MKMVLASHPDYMASAFDNDEALWELHQKLVAKAGKDGARSGLRSELLDTKIELARRIMHSCALCERRCGVDRLSGERGFCGVGKTSYYFLESISYSAEMPLVPSYSIYLSGCNFRCCYCNTRADNSWLPDYGERVQSEKLSADILSRREEINNVTFLGGEPTPHLVSILSIARGLAGKVPIVLDSNMYFSPETAKLLEGVIQIYVGNFRHANDECAMRYSGVKNYTGVVKRNLLLTHSPGRLIVRHLLLPGHFECCFLPAVRWLVENLPSVEFSLFSHYVPSAEMKGFEEIGRRISAEEMERAKNIAQENGLSLVD